MGLPSLLAFLLAGILALIFYSLYRQKTDALTAALIGLIPLLALIAAGAAPRDVIGFLCFAAGAVLTLRGFERKRDAYLVLGGAAFAGGMLASAVFVPGPLILWAVVFTFWRRHQLFHHGFLIANGATVMVLAAGIGLRWMFGVSPWPESAAAFNWPRALAELRSWAPWILLILYMPWFYLWLKRGWPWLVFALPAAVTLLAFTPALAAPLVALSGLPVLRRSLRRNPQQYWSESAMWLTGMCTAGAAVFVGSADVRVVALSALLSLAPILAASTADTRRIAQTLR